MRNSLTPLQRTLLSRLCPTPFEQEPEMLVRDGDNWKTDRTGRAFSRQFVTWAYRAGLIEDGRATQKGLLLYQKYLADHSGIPRP